MKQQFIIKENNPKLLIFFAGWACDEAPFKHYRPKGSDYMICYDYRNLDFDHSIFKQYKRVNVVAWSMGVWAASYVLNHAKKFKGISVAFNGTYQPIDDTVGIPPALFENTLPLCKNLCAESAAQRKPTRSSWPSRLAGTLKK